MSKESIQSRKAQRLKETLRIKRSPIHKLIRFVLFPIFHPFITFFLIFLLWFIPTLIGAKPAHVHNWYAAKITSFFKDVIAPIEESKTPKLKIKTAPIVGVNEIDKKSSPTYNINDRRKIFIKTIADQKSVSQEIKNEEEIVIDNNKNTQPITKDSKPQKNEVIKNNSNVYLKYLDIPEIVTGKAIILNANQILIDNKYIFLYGIYADPSSPKGIDAQMFLHQTINDKDVKCKIVAYSNEGAPTGYCTVENISLNHLLVNKGFSQNVSLGQ
ncbi:MAG: hypothetical protein R3Y43_02380 [Alphaproteobacteria bacterium]